MDVVNVRNSSANYIVRDSIDWPTFVVYWASEQMFTWIPENMTHYDIPLNIDSLANFKRKLAKYIDWIALVEVRDREIYVRGLVHADHRQLTHEEVVAWCVENDVKRYKTYYYGPIKEDTLTPYLAIDPQLAVLEDFST